jgi:hypothetical protein
VGRASVTECKQDLLQMDQMMVIIRHTHEIVDQGYKHTVINTQHRQGLHSEVNGMTMNDIKITTLLQTRIIF